MALWWLVAGAWAQTVVFSESFDSHNQASFSGTAGWVSQYPADPWSAAVTTGVECTTNEEGGTYGAMGPMDNALVYTGADFTDLQLDVQIHMEDIDGIGVVFGFQDMANTWLLVLGGVGEMPGPGTGGSISFDGSKLYEIVGGVATERASDNSTYFAPRYQDLQLIVRDNQIEAWLDLNANGILLPLLSATVTTPPEGKIGLYCYSAGDDGCGFDDVQVSHLDTDGDGTLDPVDNCLFVPNADPTDPDADGLGSGCDDDDDGDGALDLDDCEPLDPTRFPGAPEVCDGVDDDCDNTADDGLVATWYPDLDEDGFGTDANNAGEVTCAPQAGWVAVAGDCDDADDAVNPDATEVCNDLDDDCDDTPDDGLIVTWYLDGDGDGVGAGVGEEWCGPPTAGWSLEGGDCDDEDSAVLAGETRFPDEDADGFGDAAGEQAFCDEPPADWVVDDTDCDDGDDAVYPGAPEVPGDGIDQDCDDVDAPGSPPGVRIEDPGCGCATGGSSVGWLALAVLLARRRR